MAPGLSLVGERVGCLHCSAQLLSQRRLLLQSEASGALTSEDAARGLLNRLSSCGTQAWPFLSTWDLTVPGTEPMSSGFVSSVPPGQSRNKFYN